MAFHWVHCIFFGWIWFWC